MDAANRLEAIHAISQVKARYFRCLDTKDWERFESLFTSDAVFDMRDGRGTNLDPEAVILGAAAIRKFVSDAVGPLVTVHHGHIPEIELIDADHARAVWPMHDVLAVPEGTSMPFRKFQGFGHYHETYERHEGQWLIRTLRLTRLHVLLD